MNLVKLHTQISVIFLLTSLLMLTMVNQYFPRSPLGDSNKVEIRPQISFRTQPNNNTYAIRYHPILCENITWPNNGRELKLWPYWINITQPNNARVEILDWNNTFGTSIGIKTTGNHTIQLYLSENGQPTYVGNASSWNYNSITKILTATILGGKTLNLNWGTGATVRLLNPDYDYAGCIARSSHTFQVIVYAQHNVSDIKAVTLKLADGTSYEIKLKYQNGTFTEESDPYNCFNLNSTGSSATTENNKYLILNFKGQFLSNYPSLNYHESTNIAVESQELGTLPNNQQLRTFYVVLNHDRFMRSDTQEVYFLTAYKLATSQSTSSQAEEAGSGGSVTVYFYAKISVIHSNGLETQIQDYFLLFSRSSNGEGYQNKNWTCPETSLVTSDSVVVRIRIRVGSSSTIVTFITEPLGANKLGAATWTFTLYTSRFYALRFTYGTLYFGSSTYNSRIQNFGP